MFERPAGAATRLKASKLFSARPSAGHAPSNGFFGARASFFGALLSGERGGAVRPTPPPYTLTFANRKAGRKAANLTGGGVCVGWSYASWRHNALPYPMANKGRRAEGNGSAFPRRALGGRARRGLARRGWAWPRSRLYKASSAVGTLSRGLPPEGAILWCR